MPVDRKKGLLHQAPHQRPFLSASQPRKCWVPSPTSSSSGGVITVLAWRNERQSTGGMRALWPEAKAAHREVLSCFKTFLGMSSKRFRPESRYHLQLKGDRYSGSFKGDHKTQPEILGVLLRWRKKRSPKAPQKGKLYLRKVFLSRGETHHIILALLWLPMKASAAFYQSVTF